MFNLLLLVERRRRESGLLLVTELLSSNDRPATGARKLCRRNQCRCTLLAADGGGTVGHGTEGLACETHDQVRC